VIGGVGLAAFVIVVLVVGLGIRRARRSS
jgi:hypothetical protein